MGNAWGDKSAWTHIMHNLLLEMIFFQDMQNNECSLTSFGRMSLNHICIYKALFIQEYLWSIIMRQNSR